MNAREINHILSKNIATKNYFQGVFASNTLPQVDKLSKESKCFVVNFDPIEKSGSHWVCIIINPQEKSNIYFDSYGKKPSIPAICDYLKYKKCIFNCVNLQFPFSTACGQWCIFFLILYYTNHSFNCIYNFFKKNNDLLYNDYLVNNFIENLADVKLDVIDKDFLSQQIAVPKWRNNLKMK